MREHGFDALILPEPNDVRYLTGFSGDDSVLVITPRRRVIVTDSRYVEQLRQECPGLRRFVRKGPMTDAIAYVWDWLASPSTRRRKLTCALDSDAASHRQFQAYRKAIGRALTPVPSPLGTLRIHKDDLEVAALQKAVHIAQNAVRNVMPLVHPSVSERELAAIIDFAAARLGSDAPAFPTIVAFGHHTAQPHARPGSAELRKNQPILIDWGAAVDGYRSDLTRCFVLGKIPPVFAEAYRWVLETQHVAIAAVKPGAYLAEIDSAARNVLKRAKLPVYGHGTGHGVGLAVHEGPTISPKSQGLVEKGMVMTIEPAVYLPDKFGIRIEDDVLVTDKGSKTLSTLPKNLESVRVR
jgi:Xaa-Pro aminopeptidase